MGRPHQQLSDLPPEVLCLIISHTPRTTQFKFRLVSRYFCQAATPEAFRHIRLDEKGARRFERIADSPGLRRHVGEITCDGRHAELMKGHEETSRTARLNFLSALPLIRRFSGLRVLNLTFDRGHDNEPLPTPMFPFDDSAYYFRQWVMFAVFHCILGKRVVEDLEWSFETHNGRHEVARALIEGNGIMWPKYYQFLKEDSQAIQLEQLTIVNLAGAAFHSHKGVDTVNDAWENMQAFKQITALSSLKKINLLMASDKRESSPGDDYTESSNIFLSIVRCLPEWFTPSAARNLTVLSLYYDEIWGYYPKFDFRLINPGNRPDSGFPHLRVLSLARYCFSYEWQREWIASLGNNGLKELYLDECVLLSVAYCSVSRLETDGDSSVQDAGGNRFTFSNQGYLPKHWQGGYSWEPWEVYYRPNLKWNHLFNYWRASMSSLKVFKLGSTDLHTTWSQVKMAEYWLDPPPLTTAPSASFCDMIQYQAHTGFQDPAWRKRVQMQELKVPFYVNFMPEPRDSHNRDLRPWIFLPPSKEQPGAVDDDIPALAMLREAVHARSMGLVV